jgi:hypothetical protein
MLNGDEMRLSTIPPVETLQGRNDLSAAMRHPRKAGTRPNKVRVRLWRLLYWLMAGVLVADPCRSRPGAVGLW